MAHPQLNTPTLNNRKQNFDEFQIYISEHAAAHQIMPPH